MESVINVENFYFAYKKSDLVLRDINFEIKKGSFTVITGPSGAGKTTLCKAMNGIVPYYMGGRYSGDVKINGESTKGKRVSDIAMRVGFIMEDYESQLVSLTADEEIAFSLLNHGFAPHEVEERTRQALEDVGLPGRESYQLDELSGGQRQKHIPLNAEHRIKRRKALYGAVIAAELPKRVNYNDHQHECGGDFIDNGLILRLFCSSFVLCHHSVLSFDSKFLYTV